VPLVLFHIGELASAYGAACIMLPNWRACEFLSCIQWGLPDSSNMFGRRKYYLIMQWFDGTIKGWLWWTWLHLVSAMCLSLSPWMEEGESGMWEIRIHDWAYQRINSWPGDIMDERVDRKLRRKFIMFVNLVMQVSISQKMTILSCRAIPYAHAKRSRFPSKLIY